MSVPACVFIGGKGTSWATWNPRGNRDWPSGTQGKVCHPIVLESEVMRTYNSPMSHPVHALMSLSHTPQGNVGVQGQPGPPGLQGLGEPGLPVRKQHTPDIKLYTLEQDKSSLKRQIYYQNSIF